MNKNIKKEHFNDFIIPVMLILCVMPFIIRYAEYDYGYGKYKWHSQDSIMQDFYTYYRSIFFVTIVCITIAVLVFRMLLYTESIKNVKVFIPLGIYCFFVLISSILSVNVKAAFLGNIYYEGFFVITGYIVMAFYTYQIMSDEKDYKVIVKAILIMFTLISAVGWIQIFRHDLLNVKSIQKLIMTKEQFARYGGAIDNIFTGNNVFLSLYNPNYAAIFLIMFACLFMVFLLEAKTGKEKVLFAVYLADALVLCWFTYTRAALVAFATVTVFFLICRKSNIRKALFVILGSVLVFIVLLCVDYINGGKYVNRIFDKKINTKLESIETQKNGIKIKYGGKNYMLSMEDVKGGEIALPFSKKCYAESVNMNDKNLLLLYIEDYTLQFIKEEDGYYYYYTQWGKEDKILNVRSVDMHGKEYLGSGRMYIWSRTIPLLQRYIFIGSGPDTFAEVYPQNDYIGKMLYAKDTARIIEGAHNDYLMKWVQTGLVALIALLVFYGSFVVKCFGYFRKEEIKTVKEKVGFGCFLGCLAYMVCSLFSDSTIYTSPIFYVFAGMALSAVENKKNDNKKR